MPGRRVIRKRTLILDFGDVIPGVVLVEVPIIQDQISGRIVIKVCIGAGGRLLEGMEFADAIGRIGDVLLAGQRRVRAAVVVAVAIGIGEPMEAGCPGGIPVAQQIELPFRRFGRDGYERFTRRRPAEVSLLTAESSVALFSDSPS